MRRRRHCRPASAHADNQHEANADRPIPMPMPKPKLHLKLKLKLIMMPVLALIAALDEVAVFIFTIMFECSVMQCRAINAQYKQHAAVTA
ncbi:GH20780 [Drosophila grimshawi]|uniref:GH20780 n=1 Tax=Drosophila grimshawi TaxID=7222 RepID=B4JRH9_DROGR|nr:GH20780 [Drosophila grimshawi]